MTAQINDTCFHQKIDFNIAGISGSGLFEPKTVGFEPVSTSTACWRGYVAHYTILDEALYLTSLDIGLSYLDTVRVRAGKDSNPFNVRPIEDEFHGLRYRDFQFPIPFTGGLLLANDFISELYVHMGFHPAWKYKNVREVLFKEGKLTEDYDRSTQMMDFRKKATNDTEDDSLRPKRENIEAWIKQCFAREY